MKNVIYILLCLGLVACNTDAPQTEAELRGDSLDLVEPTPNEDTVSQALDTLIEDTVNTNQPEEVDNRNVIEAIYKSCAVYAGSTVYQFSVPNESKPIEVRVPFDEMELEGRPAIEVPDNMLDPNVLPENGPPGANPALVGKPFRLVYDTAGNLLAIELVE